MANAARRTPEEIADLLRGVCPDCLPKVRAFYEALRELIDPTLTASAEPVVTPEDTLAEAGIGSARQQQYQRRFSSLLAGRPDPGPARRRRKGGRA